MATLTNEDLTSASNLRMSEDGQCTVHGSGTFDDIMEAVNLHLKAQFKLGRIQGGDYAKVYAESLQAALGNAVQYLLGQANADLIAAQIRQIDENILKIKAEVELINAQKLKADAETALLAQKKVSEQAQTQAGIAADGSVLGEQIQLYSEQSKGFLWNAKRNWAKLTVDAASVDASQGEGFTDALTNSSGDRAKAEPKADGGTVG